MFLFSRIAKFKESDKAEKLARKKAKQDAAQARRDEEERIRFAKTGFLFEVFCSRLNESYNKCQFKLGIFVMPIKMSLF